MQLRTVSALLCTCFAVTCWALFKLVFFLPTLAYVIVMHLINVNTPLSLPLCVWGFN